ncbi:MAG: fibrobacter succinogenes major paralogous domain-containing protein [Bacteroidota bacterium]
MNTLKIKVLLIVFLFTMSCSESNTNVDETVNLPQVVIGNQIWMKENLSVSVFRNGDPIPYASNYEEWGESSINQKPAYCYYGDNPLNESKYGKLYNWYAVNDPRGLAPKGWHIPSDAEWTKLSDYLGGAPVAGGKMKSSYGWLSPNLGGNNLSGFNGFPGGFRDLDWIFKDSSKIGSWWTTTEAINGVTSHNRSLVYDYTVLDRFSYTQSGGLSVRCIKD